MATDEKRATAARKAGRVFTTALLIATVWCLIAAEVLTVAWNVALVPLCRVPPISFGQGLALVLLLELLAHIFHPRRGHMATKGEAGK